MAITMPSPTAAGQKWASVTPTRSTFYQAGVQAAGGKWQAAVDQSQPNWAAGVQEAVGSGRYQSGVSGKGAKYSNKAATVGTGRWQAGVGAGATAYEQGVAPVFAALSGTTLPPRFAKGNPANLARVQMVVEVERAARR